MLKYEKKKFQKIVLILAVILCLPVVVILLAMILFAIVRVKQVQIKNVQKQVQQDQELQELAQTAKKNAYPTFPQAKTPELDAGTITYTFPPGNREEIYDQGVILITGYISKKDLSHSITADYLTRGKVQEAYSSSQPLFVVEEYNLEGKLIDYYPLNGYDRVTESEEIFDFWAISGQFALKPKTIYWQIKQVSTKKVVWKDNVHTLLLKQRLNMIPSNFFIAASSYDVLRTKIEALDSLYLNKDVRGVRNSLTDLKKSLGSQLTDSTQTPTPLHTDRKKFIALIDSLLSKLD